MEESTSYFLLGILISVFSLLIILLLFNVYQEIDNDIQKDNICKQLGYEYYSYNYGKEYCYGDGKYEDVKIECKNNECELFKDVKHSKSLRLK